MPNLPLAVISFWVGLVWCGFGWVWCCSVLGFLGLLLTTSAPALCGCVVFLIWCLLFGWIWCPLHFMGGGHGGAVFAPAFCGLGGVSDLVFAFWLVLLRGVLV